jgi:hypothetical protein
MTVPSARDPLGLLDPSYDGRDEPGRDPDAGDEIVAPRRWRRALTWSTTSAPVALLLTAGLALGPQGINFLSASMLSSLDPVVPVALAALGVLVGLGGDRRSGEPRVLAAASAEAAVTLLVVAAGFAATSWARGELSAPSWLLALLAGICAATSLTLPASNPLEPRAPATRVIELGVLLPIVAGAIALAWLRSHTLSGAMVLLAQLSGITVAIAVAGWLLLRRSATTTDERVFAISVLLLVGGLADALALSALFAGLVGGLFWQLVGGTPRDTIRRDVLFVQHPLLVLVLLVAGARAELSPVALAFAAGYLALRVVGKLAGGIIARRIAGRTVPADLGLHLLSPGVFGVAFALNASTIAGAEAALLMPAVVAGTIGAEFVSLMLPPRSRVE